MTLQPGQSLLHYRLVDQIGAGGMGVVWKAVDTTLDRDVAIKVLPETLAEDPNRLVRFEREAKLLASLNHPNIAAVHSVHEVDDVRFIAMELVDGDDLAQHLKTGAMPLDEALQIARQIADALEAAHESGIIHRDLKPANVVLGRDGRVKVLDFGLAKAFTTDAASGETQLAHSPTLTSAGTVVGMILGTASYMSPEQARGNAVDKRADIWAFGCLVHEMLGGRQTFAGDTVSDTLASVLKTEPDWDALPEGTPRALRRLLRRCLAKDARSRLRDIADARIELDEAIANPDDGDAVAPTAQPATRKGVAWWTVAVGVVVGLVLGAAVVSRLPFESAPPARPLRASSPPPAGVGIRPSLAPG